MQNKLPDAKNQFEKANSIEDNSISKNNLAAIAGIEGDRVKSINLEVLKIVPEKNLLIVKGSVPGSKGSYLIVEK